MSNTIGPFEQIILNTWDLTSYGRTIHKPEADRQLKAALGDADRVSGDDDGETSIDELRDYLSFVSAWQEDYFHTKYYQEILPKFQNELDYLGELLNVELVNPVLDNHEEIKEYSLAALSYNLIYWQDDNEIRNMILSSSVADKENNLQAIFEIKELLMENRAQSSSEKIEQFKEELSGITPLLLQTLTTEEKIEQLNIIVKSNQFMGIDYHPDYGKKEGEYIIQSPIEIISQEKGERIATCSELTYLGFQIARAFNLPARIIQLEYLKPKLQENPQGGTIEGVYNTKHMALVFKTDKEDIFLDLSLSTHYQKIEHIKAMDYQQTYAQAMYEYHELDDLEMLSTYFRDTAGWLMISNEKEGVDIYNSFFQASYIVDPVNEDDDFFNLFYNVKERAEAYQGKHTLSDLFLNLYGNNRRLDYDILIDSYFNRNPYNFDFAVAHYNKTGNNWFIVSYMFALEDLISVDIGSRTYYIESE